MWLLLAFALAAPPRTPLERALDAQDRGALEQLVNQLSADAAKRPQDAKAQYQAALANSMLAQLAIETSDKKLGGSAAQAGIRQAQEAVRLDGNNAEYHRILGTLCGQVIPANVLLGMKYGRCAQDEVNKSVELNPKSAAAWTSHGVGNYYLPAAFGGGVDKAIADLEKAARLDANSSEAHLWLGIALRKAGRNADSRKALTKSLSLNPERKWARQQLEKTPAN